MQHIMNERDAVVTYLQVRITSLIRLMENEISHQVILHNDNVPYLLDRILEIMNIKIQTASNVINELFSSLEEVDKGESNAIHDKENPILVTSD